MSKEIESWNDLTLITSILIASSVLFSQDHHSVHQQKYSYLKEKQACHPRQESHALDFSCLFNSPYVLDKLHYERERLTNNGLQYFSNIIKQAVTYDAYLHKLASSYGSSGCVRRNNNLIAPQETVVYMHHNITINSQHWHYKGFKMSVNSNQNSRLSQHTSNFPDDAVDRHKTSSLDPKKDSSHGTISYQYQETIAEKGANRSLDFSGYLSSDSEKVKKSFLYHS
jgi:hypothetical protein